ncbi:MAG: hypothetical protein WHT47_05085 [Hydrogenothermaceae bacterium]
MKGKLAVVALLGVVGLSNAEVVENPILKKLVEKGILTQQEAAAIDEQLAKEEAERARYQAEIDKVAMETKEKLDKMDKKFKDMPELKGKFKKLEISGWGFGGYTYEDKKVGQDTGNFEIRRFYFKVKYGLNDKDYIRFTTDTSGMNRDDTDKKAGQQYVTKIKYAYLHKDISSLIPNTSFDIGIVHTPWIGFEEKTGWFYRAIERVFYEAPNGAFVLPSADAGLNFVTKTPYITAEYGIYNGEGYDRLNRADKGSFGHAFNNMVAARVTYHIMGDGKKKIDPFKDTYANLSAYVHSSANHRGSDKNLDVYLVHGVYNHPNFLVAGQYVKKVYGTKDTDGSGNGYSLNFEIRPNKEWAVFGRYDHFKLDNLPSNWTNWKERDQYIFGVKYVMSKHINWIANIQTVDYSGAKNNLDNKKNEFTKYMLTAELTW